MEIPLVKMENAFPKMENPLCKYGKSARYKWKIRSVEMENPLGKNEKSSRLKWKMRSVKMKNSLTKFGKILSVK
jgi:hypothetical protein